MPMGEAMETSYLMYMEAHVSNELLQQAEEGMRSRLDWYASFDWWAEGTVDYKHEGDRGAEITDQLIEKRL